MFVLRSVLPSVRSLSSEAAGCSAARLAALARPLTAAQLRNRLRATRGVTALVFLSPLILFAWKPNAAALVISTCLSVVLMLIWFVARSEGVILVPKVWQRANDQEIVQLAEMARFYPEVAQLLHEARGMGRPFTHQDWLQARAIELELGRVTVRRQAADAVEQLGRLPVAEGRR